MAAYKDLFGQKITKVTSNPGEPKTGQMWYNSTTGTLKGLGITSAWSSSSPLITAKGALGGAGIQTAAMVFGGAPAINTTEEYNGSGFSVGGTLNTGRSYMAGCGTQTAGLGFGGYTTAPNTQGQALTEEYDGSSWTESGDLNTSRYDIGAAGTQTAGLAFGGYNNGLPPGNVTNSTEEYNGTSWSSETNYPLTLHSVGASGTKTDCIVYGGYDGSNRTTSSYTYNGTTWTAGTSMNTAQASHAGGTDGTGSTGGITIGGTTATDIPTNLVQVYN